MLWKRNLEKATQVKKGKMMAYNDASNPGVEQENGADEKGAGQRDGDG